MAMAEPTFPRIRPTFSRPSEWSVLLECAFSMARRERLAALLGSVNGPVTPRSPKSTA